MAEEVKRSIKLNRPLSVLMLDIDHFKRYNDQFGHLAGDETLKKVAAIIRASMRKVDIIARYGGEEFVAVLPESSALTAHEVAERIRSSVARHDFKIYDSQTKVTVSIGISTFPDDIFPGGQTSFYDDLAFDLIRHADKALYRAKEEGRNRVFQYRDISTKSV
jgi:diguanylate cyclase (GGDEF)-like protein